MVQEIKANAPEESGEYKKSWTYKRDPDLKGKWRYSLVVYAKDPGYRLAHLLEHGHAKVNGGRVEGRPHITPAEQRAKERLVTKIAKVISR